jgi:hypothetical protein
MKAAADSENPLITVAIIVLVFLLAIGYVAKMLGVNAESLKARPVNDIQAELKALRQSMEATQRRQLALNDAWAAKAVQWQQISALLLHEMILSTPANAEAFQRRQQLAVVIERLQSGESSAAIPRPRKIDTQELKALVDVQVAKAALLARNAEGDTIRLARLELPANIDEEEPETKVPSPPNGESSSTNSVTNVTSKPD